MRLIDADALKKAIDLPFLENIKLGKIINDAPTIDAEQVVHCRECRYFKKDWWHKRGGVIVAHEVCEFWGNGCKTEENSSCSYGERGRKNEL